MRCPKCGYLIQEQTNMAPEVAWAVNVVGPGGKPVHEEFSTRESFMAWCKRDAEAGRYFIVETPATEAKVEAAAAAPVPKASRLTPEAAWEKNATLPSGERVQDEFTSRGAFLAWAGKDVEGKRLFASSR